MTTVNRSIHGICRNTIVAGFTILVVFLTAVERNSLIAGQDRAYSPGNGEAQNSSPLLAKTNTESPQRITGYREVLELKGHTQSVSSVAFSPDERWLASASKDRTLKIWDVVSGQDKLTLRGNNDMVNVVAVSPDGKLLASGSKDNTMRVWDSATVREILTTTLKHNIPDEPWNNVEAWSLTMSPCGKQRLVSARLDGTVCVWDVASGLTLIGNSNGDNVVAFSSDGRHLASVSNDATIKLWDATSGGQTCTLKGNTNHVNRVAFSKHGSLLISAPQDNTVTLWDVTTSKLLCTVKLQERMGIFGHVIFSSDGKRLASSSVDETVTVWDTTNGEQTTTLIGHTNTVADFAFSPNGK